MLTWWSEKKFAMSQILVLNSHFLHNVTSLSLSPYLTFISHLILFHHPENGNNILLTGCVWLNKLCMQNCSSGVWNTVGNLFILLISNVFFFFIDFGKLLSIHKMIDSLNTIIGKSLRCIQFLYIQCSLFYRQSNLNPESTDS